MIAIALHGGAGDRQRHLTSDAEQNELKSSIEAALQSGYRLLQAGGHSIDAVERSIMMLEDFPCFNSGVGAALNSNGEAELDAGITDGSTQKVGAVAGVLTVKHPIQAARYVMDHTTQVMYISRDAEELARSAGLEMVTNDHFITENVRKKYEMDVASNKANKDRVGKKDVDSERVVLGTVGVVALDERANLSAGNSTGGIMHKPAGRVGDTPLNGAGMCARNTIAATACTGHGEYFVRTVAAYDVIARMRYLSNTLSDATLAVLKEIQLLGGRGGIIGVDAQGNVTMQFNTTSMVRASIDAQGNKVVELW